MSTIRTISDMELNNIDWITEEHLGRPYVVVEGKIQLCESRKVAIVEHDEMPIDPIDEFEMLGTLACCHKDYNLGHDQPRQDPNEYRISLVEEFDVDFGERLENRASRLEDQLYTRKKSQLGNDLSMWSHQDIYQQVADMVDRAIEAKFEQYYLALPLYLHDHGGITMNTTGFSCGWDSGQLGYIYVSKADVRKEYGWRRLTAKRIKRVESVLRAKVEAYDNYLTGNVWQYKVEHQAWDPVYEEWDTIQANLDGRCGFFGHFGDPLKTGIIDHLKDDVDLIINTEFDDEYDAQALRQAA